MSVEPQPAAARGILNEPPSWGAHALAGVRHGFFGNRGGVSTGVYASLNAGTGSRDDPAQVRENRRRIATALGAAPEQLIGVHQLHSPDVVFVEAPWAGERPHADALVTKTPGLAISILTADCAPVLLADVEAGVIGAAHAGWRGALGGVLENTIALMEAHGAKTSRICAAIGPCIHRTSYDVGPEFEAAFIATAPDYARFFTAGAGDRRKFDLPGFCTARLSARGLRTVETLPLDTYTHPEQLHSHRRSTHQGAADYGRNCSAIMLS